MQLRQLPALLFGFRTRVSRRTYALTGFSLMGFKYAGDLALVRAGVGGAWTPLDYFSPLLATRAQLSDGDAAVWLLPAIVLWTIPFIWIGASMTLRRALDAGFPSRVGLAFFVPVVNYLWMLALCVFPSAPPLARVGPAQREQFVPKLGRDLVHAAWPAALFGALMVPLCIFVVESYGAMLFIGTPVAMGFIAGVRANSTGSRQVLASAQLSVVIAGGSLLLFALEGVICLALAWPLAAVLATVGALLGESVGRQDTLSTGQIALLLCLLPALMAAESASNLAPLREVISTVEIDAPPETVWPNVVGFGELPPASRLAFQLGIAHPLRARIEGEGVGAVRYCEFSTGPFVEPITVWDAPHRLAFDVASQPEPMHETSPYQVVHAPHLLSGLQSERGEFRLARLPGNRTRLEGSTWYRVNLWPQPYWGLISDALIHEIHERVLDHVKHLAESPSEPS